VTAGPDGVSRYRGPEYRRLLAAARRSLERTGGDLGGAVGVASPDEAERNAIIGITGRYRPAATGRVTVRLADLDSAVRTATGAGLPELLTRLGGPLDNRPERSSALAAARATVIRSAQSSFLMGSRSWYPAWLQSVVRDGTLTKLIHQGEQHRLGIAVRVLEHLAARPAGSAPLMIPALAAAITGDTKALKDGSAQSTLVLRALAMRAGTGRPASAADRRQLWESAGVVVDDLASRVLVLNLPADGPGLGEWLSGAAGYGTPFQVTLHQLTTHPIRVRAAVVFACENPAVLRRAAAELGAACAPLLCTEGQPSMAFRRLAQVITDGGGQLRYHGDFDWPGIAITAGVTARHLAVPWRMTAACYLAGVSADTDHVVLTGEPRPTPWDPGLAMAMRETGRAVYEETVADDLLDDLRRDDDEPGG
jgi:uncharacterized protein (TIGR02679 family)